MVVHVVIESQRLKYNMEDIEGEMVVSSGCT